MHVFSDYKMKKGRPPKNPVEIYRTLTLMSTLRWKNRDLRTGYQLEKFFEPNIFPDKNNARARSCKWDRYLKGVTPRKESLALVERRYPTAMSYYNSSLWSALKAGEQTPQYWTDFYSSIDEDLRTLCYRFKTVKCKKNSSMSLSRAKREPLEALMRIGTHEALACLFALLREAEAREDITEYIELEYALHHDVFWVLSENPFHGVAHQILHYLDKYIFRQGNKLLFRIIPESPFKMSPQKAEERMWINGKNIMLAEDIGLFYSREQGKEFRYWKYKGDNFLIVREMAEAMSVQKYKLPDSHQGLKWLIGKLNKTREKNNQLPLDYL